MTVTPSSIDLKALLEKEVLQASPDLIRELLQIFINTLLSAEADAVCGAEYGARDASRSNRRNGYRHRELDTRAGTIDVAVPKLREGSYFPDWLLERKKRAERALTSVVATCYLLGVSTRRMDKLVGSLGITSLSKSQVSDMAAELDEQVEAFRTRPLDAGPYTLVAADAMVARTHQALAKYYRLILMDSGNDESDPLWLKMIELADQIVVATTTRADHAEAGALLLDGLAEGNEHSAKLADNAVVVVSQAEPKAPAAEVRRVATGFSTLAREVVQIPFDPAMVDGHLKFDALRPTTQRAWLQAAAAAARGL